MQQSGLLHRARHRVSPSHGREQRHLAEERYHLLIVVEILEVVRPCVLKDLGLGLIEQAPKIKRNAEWNQNHQPIRE